MHDDPGGATRAATPDIDAQRSVNSSLVELGTLTWPTLAHRPLVLVPLGSTEQHGPHLPLHTDTVIANAVAAALTPQAGKEVVVAPAINYGASGEHQAFPGTMSIGTPALRNVLVELVRSASSWAGEVVIVNGHGGNLEALTHAVPQLRHDGHAVAWASCYVPGGDAHAGRTETSLMLYLAPDQVRTEAFTPGITTSIYEILPRLRREGVRPVSPTGVLGDPTGATAREGHGLFQQIVKSLDARIRAGHVDGQGRLVVLPTHD